MKNRVKELRTAAGMTQQQLADRVHVSSRTIISLEKELYNPSLLLAYRIAELFGVTVDYLLCRQPRRFLDISELNEEEAAVVCSMVELLKRK